VRLAQRELMKTGRLRWRDAWLEPLCAARRELLGERADGAPRFLVRVDEFPSATRYYVRHGGESEATLRFHETMLAAGVPYLMAVLPEPALDPLNADATGSRALTEEELELLSRLQADGVAFAQHGTTHRTRRSSPRRRSELTGLTAAELGSLIDRGREILERHGIRPRVFVPPFNRFDARQYEVLAERFDVICGGPESVTRVGFHGGPLWRGDAVYLPAYEPLYGRADAALPMAREMIERQPGTWIPIALHTVWEFGDLAPLRELCDLIAPCAVSWQTFLDDVDRAGAVSPSP
jgi:hypothetical protein